MIAGAYAQATLATSLGPELQRNLALSEGGAFAVAASIVLLGLSAMQVVFGELVPKSIALQFPARTALATFHPMRWSIRVYRPFIWLLNGSGLLLLRPFGISPGGQPHVHSPRKLELLFAESRRGGTLSPELHGRLRHVLRLSRRTVHQLMVPRSQLVTIEMSTPDSEIVHRVLESPHSRLPVYRDMIDNLIGIVSTRDLVASYVRTGRIPPLTELVRPIPFVPENLTADRLVSVLRAERTSKAIVVDEYGGVQGMISIDDLLVELFGELGDELKPSREAVEVLADGTVRAASDACRGSVSGSRSAAPSSRCSKSGQPVSSPSRCARSAKTCRRKCKRDDSGAPHLRVATLERAVRRGRVCDHRRAEVADRARRRYKRSVGDREHQES